MRALMYRWHRRLALLIALPVMALVIGGLMHPLMSHVWVPDMSPGAAPLPALPAAEAVLSPQALLQRHQLIYVDQINLLEVDGEWLWQTVIYAGTAAESADNSHSPYQEAMPPAVQSLRYFSALTGVEQADGAARHAAALSRYWLDAPITQSHVIDHFTRTYRSINRVLPVVQVQLNDPAGHHLYLDLIGQRLIAVDHRWRRVGLQLFARLHNWDFLGERHDPRRLLPLLTVVGLTMVTLLLGVAQLLHGFFLRRSRPMTARPRHVYLGLTLLVTTLAFTLSGFETALSQWHKETHFAWRADTRAESEQMRINPLNYRHDNTVALSQAWLDGELFWQLRDRDAQGEDQIRYISAAGGVLRADADIAYAQALLSQWLGGPVALRDSSRRTTFGMDYPAIFTRLPVVRLALAEGPLATAFVETHSGHIAHITTPASAARAMRFLVLHKYHLLDGLGARGRDAVMSLAAIGVLLLALSGVLLRWRRWQRTNRA